MSDRFSYVKYDDDSVDLQNKFKDLFTQIEYVADANLPNASCGRAKALLITKLEEAYMWVGKAIRDKQRAERDAEEQPERKDG